MTGLPVRERSSVDGYSIHTGRPNGQFNVPENLNNYLTSTRNSFTSSHSNGIINGLAGNFANGTLDNQTLYPNLINNSRMESIRKSYNNFWLYFKLLN